jgi:hypothetical protein
VRWLRRVLFGEGQPPIQVLVTDRRLRRSLARHLHAGLHRLQGVVGDGFGTGQLQVAVVVQQTIGTGRGPLAGCCHAAERPEGSRFALIRLALEVNGRHLTTDELLAALSEQFIGLVTGQAAPVGEVLAAWATPVADHIAPAARPLSGDPARPAPAAREAAFLPDPLAPPGLSAPFIPAHAHGAKESPFLHPTHLPHFQGHGPTHNGNAA